ncbi:helicase-related protein [Streptococcus pneumoniae]
MEIDNRAIRLGDELKKVILPNSRIKIAAATFSMFAYKALKEELEQIEELRFIFTNPTFVTDGAKKEFREYAIPKKKRENSVFGAEYELKLMNELTQKALARECADWVKRKVQFKSINVEEEINDGIRIEAGTETYAIDRLKNFDLKELGYEPSLFQTRRNLYQAPHSQAYLQEFDDYWRSDEYFRDVTEEILDNLSLAYKEQTPEFLYYVMLYNVFSEFLEDIQEDHLPNEDVKYRESKVWNLLYDFQKDAVVSLISKLEKYNGCILADSVGLGKTFTALAVMTYYAYRGKRILVLCPKKLENNWNMYRHDYKNNPIYDRYLQYDVLYHTDLSRDKGTSNGIDLALNRWDTYDLVVIDESHNFRNGGNDNQDDGRENRYNRLMNRIIKQGVPTKVLMLSATPVNNRFNDLKNQIALAYEGDAEKMDDKLDTKTSINDIFRLAQTEYNKWAELPAEERTTARLLERLDFDFFKVLDSVTIARSRKHIREFYDKKAIGDFPTRLKPQNYYPNLTVQEDMVTYKEIYNLLSRLNLMIYQPSFYIHPSKLAKYDKSGGKGSNLTQMGRERGVQKLMMINLLKRLESSVEAFRYTLLDVVKAYIEKTLKAIEQFEQSGGQGVIEEFSPDEADFDMEDSNTDYFVGKKMQISLQDVDYLRWKDDLTADFEILTDMERLVERISPENDAKLQGLYKVIDEKIKHPINKGNKKIIIFSAFATTTQYLYQHVSRYVYENYGLHTAQISGASGFATTLPTKHKDLNSLLTYFSPISKSKDVLFPDDEGEIDILIATDVISEGQNLQDADMLVNYDIHWNPVRIIQRFGRVDRIGSKNQYIQLVNFWPNIELDEYINLKSRVETRMKISVLTSTGDDNILSSEEQDEANYRKKQLERLKEEVVDLEDMSEGISIMDLGFEEYRMDMMRYLKEHPELERAPKGLQTVVKATDQHPAGAIFLLKNVAETKGLSQKNRLHPYYLVYMGEAGQSVIPISETKTMLETMRLLCKGKEQPDEALVQLFKRLTNDGQEMTFYSDLLQGAIEQLMESDETSFIDTLFDAGQLDFGKGIEGMDDFELICFFIVMKGDS